MLTPEDANSGQDAPTQGSAKRLARERKEKLDKGRREYVARLLERLAPHNRSDAERLIREKRASGLAETSVRNVTVCLAILDAETNGTPWRGLTRDQLSTATEALAKRRSPATVNGWAANCRSFLRWLHDDEPPKGLLKGLKRKHEATYRDVQPVTDAELEALLAAAADTTHRKSALLAQAIIWALWDSGYRISELMALRVMDFQLDEKGGARLRLRDEEPDLKTDARTVYVVDCVPALVAWLGVHPMGGDPLAPLFPSRLSKGDKALLPRNVNQMFDRLTKRAGLRHINPHLFRHTRATRAARAGWNEPQMRGYFGWSDDSDMPAHYIHLAERDMEDRVRRDAGIDALGRKQMAQLDEASLDAMLRRQLRKLLTEDDG